MNIYITAKNDFAYDPAEPYFSVVFLFNETKGRHSFASVLKTNSPIKVTSGKAWSHMHCLTGSVFVRRIKFWAAKKKRGGRRSTQTKNTDILKCLNILQTKNQVQISHEMTSFNYCDICWGDTERGVGMLKMVKISSVYHILNIVMLCQL